MTIGEMIEKLEHMDKTKKAVVATHLGVVSVKNVFTSHDGRDVYLDVRK